MKIIYNQIKRAVVWLLFPIGGYRYVNIKYKLVLQTQIIVQIVGMYARTSDGNQWFLTAAPGNSPTFVA
ncbi:MAG TPA: hypothetical protein DCE24_02935 [Porphyromonadaceae bacterium]|nr:hypothetical protein [Porphyromonadaceae bacterium]